MCILKDTTSDQIIGAMPDGQCIEALIKCNPLWYMFMNVLRSDDYLVRSSLTFFFILIDNVLTRNRLLTQYRTTWSPPYNIGQSITEHWILCIWIAIEYRTIHLSSICTQKGSYSDRIDCLSCADPEASLHLHLFRELCIFCL